MAITDPLDIPNCVLWLDSTDATKVSYQELNAGDLTLVEDWGDGSPKNNLRIFSSWTDKSPTGAVISQTSWKRPRIQAAKTAMNSIPSIRFDGGASLTLPQDLMTYDACSVFFVGLSENTTDNPLYPGGCFMDTTSRREHFGFYIRPDATFEWKIGRGDTPGTLKASTAADQNKHIFGLQLLKGYGDISVDGVNIKFGICAFGDTVDNLSLGAVGGAYTYEDSRCAFLKGNLGDVIFYNRAIDTTEKADLLAWLGTKWNISVP